MTFIDFSKAFDSVSGQSMKEIILLACGIATKIVNLVRALYIGATALLVVPDEQITDFGVNAGVLQGDTLAHYILIIVVDFVLPNAINEIALNCWCC